MNRKPLTEEDIKKAIEEALSKVPEIDEFSVEPVSETHIRITSPMGILVCRADEFNKAMREEHERQYGKKENNS